MEEVVCSFKEDTVQYLRTKYARCIDGDVIYLHRKLPLYYHVEDLILASPRRSFIRPEGNITLAIPSLRPVKKLMTYPLISKENNHSLEVRIDTEMRIELFDLLLKARYCGKTQIQVYEEFVKMYNLPHLSKDAALRGFRRWCNEMKSLQ